MQFHVKTSEWRCLANLAMQGFGCLLSWENRKLEGSSCVSSTERHQNGSRVFTVLMLATQTALQHYNICFSHAVLMKRGYHYKMVIIHPNPPCFVFALMLWLHDWFQGGWTFFGSYFTCWCSLFGNHIFFCVKWRIDAHSHHHHHHHHHQIKLDRSVLKVHGDTVI